MRDQPINLWLSLISTHDPFIRPLSRKSSTRDSKISAFRNFPSYILFNYVTCKIHIRLCWEFAEAGFRYETFLVSDRVAGGTRRWRDHVVHFL